MQREQVCKAVIMFIHPEKKDRDNVRDEYDHGFPEDIVPEGSKDGGSASTLFTAFASNFFLTDRKHQQNS